jgi:hypothetical protein
MSSCRSRSGRQAHAHDVETMQQVFAEQSLPHALLEILVRGRDHADVRLLRRVAPDAVILAVGEHAQEAHLQIGRHVADLVQEQRPAFRLLEAAPARALRTGERAALVSEELGLEQILRDRRGVDRDERSGRPWAVAMERSRDELLPRSRTRR